MSVRVDIADLRCALVEAARAAAAQRRWSAVASALTAYADPGRAWMAWGSVSGATGQILDVACAAFGDAVRSGDLSGAMALEEALHKADASGLAGVCVALLDAIERQADPRWTIEGALCLQLRGWVDPEAAIRLRACVLREAAAAGAGGDVEAVIDLVTLAEGLATARAQPSTKPHPREAPTVPSNLASRSYPTAPAPILTQDLIDDTRPQHNDEIPWGAL